MNDELNKLKSQLADAEEHCIKYEEQITVLEHDVNTYKNQYELLAKENNEFKQAIQELRDAIKYISKLL